MKTFIFIVSFLFFHFYLVNVFSKTNESKIVEELERKGVVYQCVKKGLIQYQIKNATEMLTENYCYNLESGSILNYDKCFFKSCKSEQVCVAVLKQADIDSSYGSYEFKLCSACDGKGQIFEFLDPKSHQYIKTTRCIFRDGSFIDLGTLLRESKITIE